MVVNKVGIVILNYLNYKDTLECVESIANLDYPSIEIVVVENGSANESREALKQRFGNDPRVTLLCSDTNLGYANGNNIGITFCREYKKCDYVLIANNDTIFDQADFLQILISADKENELVGAIGPKILNNNGSNNNPIDIDMNTKRIFKDLLINLSILLGVYKLIKKLESSLVNNKDQAFEKPLISNEGHPFILHGSAILLTPLYLNTFRGLYPGTFLYYEENILGIIFKKNQFQFLYQPNAVLLHKEDGSSKISNNNSSRINAKRHIRSIGKAAWLWLNSRSTVNEVVNSVSDGEKQFYKKYLKNINRRNKNVY
jgi:Predicted glycosyltransferases